MAKIITQRAIDKVLKEAAKAQLGDERGPVSAAGAGTGFSLASFRTLWPKVRPALLLSISLLKMFRRGDMANGVAQVITVLDLIVGTGELPA